jgi:hypothetical protein
MLSAQDYTRDGHRCMHRPDLRFPHQRRYRTHAMIPRFALTCTFHERLRPTEFPHHRQSSATRAEDNRCPLGMILVVR